MATITLQKGHCFRKSGATGTAREQEFVNGIGDILAKKLTDRGHVVHIVLADTASPYPASDAFIALHTDGSSDPNRRGASVGYANANGGRLAAAWKRAHQRRGYSGGFIRDNYTAALSGYYGYGRARATHEFLAEHGTTTNATDRDWLFANQHEVAEAHVDAIGELFGHPKSVVTPPPAPPADGSLAEAAAARNPVLQKGSTGHYVRIGQALMIAHNAWTEGGRIDGDFGPGTESALGGWQTKVSPPLSADGKVTSDDWKFMIGVPPAVQQGSTGHYVRAMQALMIAHNAWTEGGKCDGQFGPGTHSALLAWQRRTGSLTPDGICGPRTWAWLVGV